VICFLSEKNYLFESNNNIDVIIISEHPTTADTNKNNIFRRTTFFCHLPSTPRGN
jgi:hypothetical protein